MGIFDTISGALKKAASRKKVASRKKAVYVVVTKSDGTDEIITQKQLHKIVSKAHHNKSPTHSMSKSNASIFKGKRRGRTSSLELKIGVVDKLMKNGTSAVTFCGWWCWLLAVQKTFKIAIFILF